MEDLRKSEKKKEFISIKMTLVKGAPTEETRCHGESPWNSLGSPKPVGD